LGIAAAPLAPQNLQINVSANDVLISWEPVSQTIAGTTVAPDFYFIYASPDPYGAFNLFGISPAASYTHSFVLSGAPRLFYRVTAVKIYRGDQNGGDLNSYLRSLIQLGMSEEEVKQALRGR